MASLSRLSVSYDRLRVGPSTGATAQHLLLERSGERRGSKSHLQSAVSKGDYDTCMAGVSNKRDRAL